MMGLRIGTRMTLVRLRGGGLLLHSALPLTEARRRAVDTHGVLTHIVAPNAFHHRFAPEWANAYPNAIVHGPLELRKKSPGLRLDRLLSDPPDRDWSATLEPLTIEGSMLKETVFVHTPSRTLISSDLVENQNQVDHLPTRLYLQLSGVYQRVGWPRPLRFLYRDKAAARRSIDRLLERDFDRLIIAHGDVIERDAKAALRCGLEFLG